MGQNKKRKKIKKPTPVSDIELYIWSEKQWKPSLSWRERTLSQQDGLQSFPTCERKKRGNEEIFRGCSSISRYAREYEETAMQFLIHLMVTVSSYILNNIHIHTQAFRCSYPGVSQPLSCPGLLPQLLISCLFGDLQPPYNSCNLSIKLISNYLYYITAEDRVEMQPWGLSHLTIATNSTLTCMFHPTLAHTSSSSPMISPNHSCGLLLFDVSLRRLRGKTSWMVREREKGEKNNI